MSSDEEPNSKLLSRFRLLDSPGHLIRRNHQRSYEIFTQIVGDDVTRQQVALLIALYQNPGATQNMLVGATGFDRATIAEMMGRLVARGLVERARDSHDGRAWTMHVTPAGEAMLLERIPQIVAAQEEILRPLPDDLRPVFIRCLHILLGLAPAASENQN
jgi:DNA-binding MarR family transcriptional regulator